jgi:citrate lyase beta subunit
MKKTILLSIFLLFANLTHAQLLDKLKRKAEDKIIQKAEDALNGKNKKTADNAEKAGDITHDNPENEVRVKRNFDFVPGNKVL